MHQYITQFVPYKLSVLLILFSQIFIIYYSYRLGEWGGLALKIREGKITKSERKIDFNIVFSPE